MQYMGKKMELIYVTKNVNPERTPNVSFYFSFESLQVKQKQAQGLTYYFPNL